MKNQQWRRDPLSYGFMQEIQSRYSDIDVQRHVNNVSVYGMHAEAGMRFQLHLLGDDAWETAEHVMHPTHAETNYLGITHYPGPLQCGVRLLAVDEYECTLATGLFQSGTCVSIQEQRLAVWHEGRQQPLPEAVRTALLAHQARQETPVSWSNDRRPVHVPEIDTFPSVSAEVPPRFSDFDADRCTSAKALMRYTEQARSVGMTSAFAHVAYDRFSGQIGNLVARIGIDIVARRAARGNMRWAVGVSHVGNASITLRTGVFDKRGCMAVGDNVLVFINRRDGRPTSLPHELRDYFREPGRLMA